MNTRMNLDSSARQPACWQMHWSEVAVLDANAAALGVEQSDLMTAAGAVLASHAADMVAGSRDEPILILCGPGNNGGDGFVAARILLREGWDVTVIASHAESQGEIAAQARKAAADAAVKICMWPQRPSYSPSLVVDCLLGAGAAGPGVSLRGAIAEIADWVKDFDVPILACDIPSGLSGPDELAAKRCVTFHSDKRGLDAEGAGEVVVESLPWPAEVEDCGRGDAHRYPALKASAHKGERGRVLIIGGGPYHGAPLLAGMAAARAGCDLVHVAMPRAALARAEWPTNLIPEPLLDEEFLSLESLERISEVLTARRIDAMVIGPGLGTAEETITAVGRIIDLAIERGIPTVVDADGLRALPTGRWPEGLIGVATPHAGEAKRWLSGVTPADALLAEAGESAAIVITGAVDSLTSPEGRHCRATGGHPRMAVGGTGDLLAGLIGGLLAIGMQAWPAARLACALLRQAGLQTAEEEGPGLQAADVARRISRVLGEWIGG